MRQVIFLSICVVLAGAFELTGRAGNVEPSSAVREAAIEAIVQLGGTVRTTGQKLDVSFRNLNIANHDLKHLKGLPDLAHLELSGTPITDTSLVHLKELTGLEQLSLYDTKVGDAGLEHLKGLTRLKLLMVKQTNVTEGGVEQFQRALPECLISHSTRCSPMPPAKNLPVGNWQVAFANGVNQTCTIGKDGTTSVVEPRRTANGKATAVKGGTIVIVFEDDVIERWTPVGNRYVVQFWFPGSQFPTAAPLLGVADGAP